jgi:hypothetical protein
MSDTSLTDTERETLSVTIDEPEQPDPKTLLATYMLRDGYTGEEVEAYFAARAARPVVDSDAALYALVDEWKLRSESKIIASPEDHCAALLDRLLASGSIRDERAAKAEALREEARYFTETMGEAWGGPKAWLTTGTHVADLVAGILFESSDEIGDGE